MLEKVFIPYKAYFSSPFCRWQGSFSNENAIVLAAQTIKKWLSNRGIDPKGFESLFLGYTIPQPSCFYGSPWLAALIGAEGISGPIFSQACATSTTTIANAGFCVEAGTYQILLTVMTDRCSNGPHLVWANPKGPGGQPDSENWMMDNFNDDPWARNAMIQTAENVAKEAGISREACDALTLRRYSQYTEALSDERAFQKGYMFPVEVKIGKDIHVIEQDEGIIETTFEGLARLKPVLPGGVHTFGSQTHPADGHVCLIVTTKERARALSTDPLVEIQIISYGYSRVEKGYMAKAVVPAAQLALEKAGLTTQDLKAVKTHNPFAVNDIYMAEGMGLNLEQMNNYGSSLIFGHPQGPTAGRCIIELIEELVKLGGGFGLFSGCAAGDTGAALVVKVQ